MFYIFQLASYGKKKKKTVQFHSHLHNVIVMTIIYIFFFFQVTFGNKISARVSCVCAGTLLLTAYFAGKRYNTVYLRGHGTGETVFIFCFSSGTITHTRAMYLIYVYTRVFYLIKIA